MFLYQRKSWIAKLFLLWETRYALVNQNGIVLIASQFQAKCTPIRISFVRSSNFSERAIKQKLSECTMKVTMTFIEKVCFHFGSSLKELDKLPDHFKIISGIKVYLRKHDKGNNFSFCSQLSIFLVASGIVQRINLWQANLTPGYPLLIIASFY